jgi:biopolymer transport protein ExbB
MLSAFALAQDPDAVRTEALINSAKADLETARQGRDQIMAARWQDKKTAMDAREEFNDKYRDARQKLDIVAAEKSRILEELRALKIEIEQSKMAAEKARSEFLALGAQEDRLDGLVQTLKLGVPFELPERIQRLNEVRQKMDLQKDNPIAIYKAMTGLALKELEFTRQISLSEGDLLFQGNEPGRGSRLRLGGLGAFQYDPVQNRSALMLPVAGEKGKIFSWQENLTEVEKSMIAGVFKASPDSGQVYLPVDILLSTSLSSEIASQKETSLKDKVAVFFKEGGFLLYPIVALFIIALLFSAERFVVWVMRNRASAKQIKAFFALCEQKEWEQAEALCQKKLKGSIGLMLQKILRVRLGKRIDGEKAAEEVMAHEIPLLEKRLSSISVMGSAAPLLGLLGTVYGMIQLFEVITMYGTSDPKLLAGGISVALITTEMGLAVAIPVQLIHNFISNRMDQLISDCEKHAIRLINIIWSEQH